MRILCAGKEFPTGSRSDIIDPEPLIYLSNVLEILGYVNMSPHPFPQMSMILGSLGKTGKVPYHIEKTENVLKFLVWTWKFP